MTSHGTGNHHGFKPRLLYSLRNYCDYMNVYRRLSHGKKVRNITLSSSQNTLNMLHFGIGLLQVFLAIHKKDFFFSPKGVGLDSWLVQVSIAAMNGQWNLLQYSYSFIS